VAIADSDRPDVRQRFPTGGAEVREPLEDRRELGASESLTCQVHLLGGLMAGGLLRISGPLTPELVRRGLDWLQDEHPILRAHLAVRGLKFFTTFPFIQPRLVFDTRGTLPIPLRHVIDPGPEAGVRILQEELRKRIPVGRLPRLRAVLVQPHENARTSELIICADHTIADIQSAMNAHRQLLEFLGAPQRAPAPRGRQARLPPALETVFSKKSSRERGYEPMIRLPIERHRKSAVGTAVERRMLTAAETDVLKKYVKIEGSTIHAVVTAAILKGIHARFGMEEMTVLSSVDLRRLCSPPVPPDVYGCYIDIIRTRHRIDQPLWDLARDVGHRLLTTLARDQQSASALRLPTWAMLKAELVPLISSGFRADGLVMTTAGEVNLGRSYGDIVLEDMSGMISQEVVGAGFFGYALERQGALEITLCYAPHCLSAASAAAVADTAAASLRLID
jgi:hypothetical protein